MSERKEFDEDYITDEDDKLFDSLPKVNLALGINNKNSFIASDNVFNHIIKIRKEQEIVISSERERIVKLFELLKQRMYELQSSELLNYHIVIREINKVLKEVKTE